MGKRRRRFTVRARGIIWGGRTCMSRRTSISRWRRRSGVLRIISRRSLSIRGGTTAGSPLRRCSCSRARVIWGCRARRTGWSRFGMCTGSGSCCGRMRGTTRPLPTCPSITTGRGSCRAGLTGGSGYGTLRRGSVSTGSTAARRRTLSSLTRRRRTGTSSWRACRTTGFCSTIAAQATRQCRSMITTWAPSTRSSLLMRTGGSCRRRTIGR